MVRHCQRLVETSGPVGEAFFVQSGRSKDRPLETTTPFEGNGYKGRTERRTAFFSTLIP